MQCRFLFRRGLTCVVFFTLLSFLYNQVGKETWMEHLKSKVVIGENQSKQRSNMFFDNHLPNSNIITKTENKTTCPTPNDGNWSFNCTVPCHQLPRFPDRQTRIQINIDCQYFGTFRYITSYSTLSVQTIVDQRCLSLYIEQNCYNGSFQVPNVVHYIWFSKHRMNFYHFLSAISASKILKPCLILYHGEFQPFGKYWKFLIHMVPNIVHVKLSAPGSIFGKPFGFIEHKADIARMQTLQKYGGIYIDADGIILKSLDPLRNYSITLSHEIDNNLSNGLILATKNATFLNIWFEKYKTYDGKQWAYHSTIMPWILAKKYPDLIHVENGTFVRPNFMKLALLFNKNFDWSDNYGIHLYIRFYKKAHDFEDIKYLNTTIGSVARYILYGSKELCFK